MIRVSRSDDSQETDEEDAMEQRSGLRRAEDVD